MYIIRVLNINELIKEILNSINLCIYRLSVSFIVPKESHCSYLTINFTYGGEKSLIHLDLNKII